MTRLFEQKEIKEGIGQLDQKQEDTEPEHEEKEGK